METVTITASEFKPTGKPVQNTLEDAFEECAGEMQDMLDAFEEEDEEDMCYDEPEGCDAYDGDIPPEQEEAAEKAKNTINGFKSFITGQGFKDMVEETHEKTGLPRKQLAEGFFKKALGTIGDTLGVVVSCAGSAAHTLVNILDAILHGGVSIMCKIANALVSLVTLNQTNVAYE